MPKVTRRGFHTGLLAAASSAAQTPPTAPAAGPAADEPHLGNLYPLVQKQADRSPVALSFLRPEFRSLRQWQPRARARVLDLLLYPPPPGVPDAQVLRKTDHGDYLRED